MKDPKKAANIIRAMCTVCGNIPVTAKLRLGWDGDCICVVEMAKRLEEAGAAALCIHARTRAEMYTPGIHPEYIGAVKDTVAVPL